jgi:hypothetical protein
MYEHMQQKTRGADACGQITGGAMQAAHQYRPDMLAQGEIGRAEPVRDTSEVERELQRLDAAVMGLHKLAAELGERLRPVSSPRPEASGCNSAEPRAGSPLGAMVQDQRNGVLAAAVRIREAIDALAI